jgi:uncharacterized membrane protein HdeD (DUF308 family)
MKYIPLIRGCLFVAIGLFLFASPLDDKPTMSYVIGGCALAYGGFRIYMAYQQLYGAKKQ